jgi:pyruvate/2-oxoglutarate dehydrogenase complex dihydrolipoamide dehydrogenase (E3) component
MILGCEIERVERRGDERLIHLSDPVEGARTLAVDAILVGAGRAPNVEGLGLESVGVAHDAQQGVVVDDTLRTTNRRIWAVGDVCMQWKFTHAADAAAKIVVQNALFAVGPFGRRRLSDLVMPWCTYTEPEIAHVGLYERDAAAQKIEIDTYRVPMAEANRAVTDGQEDGLVKVHVKKGTDRIVGATIVAAHAGDLITQLTIAIQQGMGLGSFGNVIYPYPTQGEAIKRAAGAYTRTRLTPGVKRLFERWIAWRR